MPTLIQQCLRPVLYLRTHIYDMTAASFCTSPYGAGWWTLWLCSASQPSRQPTLTCPWPDVLGVQGFGRRIKFSYKKPNVLKVSCSAHKHGCLLAISSMCLAYMGKTMKKPRMSTIIKTYASTRCACRHVIMRFSIRISGAKPPSAKRGGWGLHCPE